MSRSARKHYHPLKQAIQQAMPKEDFKGLKRKKYLQTADLNIFGPGASQDNPVIHKAIQTYMSKPIGTQDDYDKFVLYQHYDDIYRGYEQAMRARAQAVQGYEVFDRSTIAKHWTTSTMRPKNYFKLEPGPWPKPLDDNLNPINADPILTQLASTKNLFTATSTNALMSRVLSTDLEEETEFY